jgi:hypothetical protein
VTSTVNTSSILRDNKIPVIVSSLLLILVGILGFSTAALPSMILPGGFAEFSMAIGDWKGRTETMDIDIVKQSGAEEALNATQNDHLVLRNAGIN